MKIKLQKTKTISGSLYRLSLITEHHYFYSNYQEGDENGNTLMYDRQTDKLIADNYFAYVGLEEILENESTPISPIHFIKHDTHSLPINKESKESKEQKESNEPKKSNESKEIKEIILPNDNIIKENIKIVLAPKKKKEHRVILSRKRKQINNINITGGFKNKTRKVSFNLLKHKKRLTRAKKIFDQSNKLSIDRIKKELINKNIIKSTSKAPESILRQIYNDALIVANKAL